MLNSTERLWKEFFTRQQLSSLQQEQFKEYYTRLVATNTLHNITAITDLAQVITDHFDDSLALRDIIAISSLRGLADIGTGAGFPGVPLKLVYPELPLVLIEVNAKKRAFLQELVDEFSLRDVIISELDWRTFLRKTDYTIDLFCARASLQPEELIRVFMASSPYKHAKLVYWASHTWQPSVRVAPFLHEEYVYTIGHKTRRLVLMNKVVTDEL